LDLIIKNANVWRGVDEKLEIGDLYIADGCFVAPPEDGVAPANGSDAAETIDAMGRLCVAGFVEPHIHLDKAHINEDVRVNVSGTLDEAIEIIWERKRAYVVEEIAERAGRVIRSALANGVTRIRSHVDVDNIGGLRPLEGVAEARRRHRNVMDVQIVAFPQEGILKNKGAEKLMWQAMEAGADVVGGMPFNEKHPQDSARHISIAFEIAKAFDADIDMHVDETDDVGARTLEMLAEQTIEHGWQGRVTAGHTCALAGYDEDYASAVIALVREAEIHMITNPATNLMLQGRFDAQPKRRGITRVKELLAEGINVSFGQDCVKDTFYPFGRVDPLEVGLIAAHAAHMSLPQEVEQVFDMQTNAAARVMRLADYGFAPGCAADLVILDAESAAEALCKQAARNTVIKAGRVIVESKIQQDWRWAPAK